MGVYVYSLLMKIHMINFDPVLWFLRLTKYSPINPTHELISPVIKILIPTREFNTRGGIRIKHTGLQTTNLSISIAWYSHNRPTGLIAGNIAKQY